MPRCRSCNRPLCRPSPDGLGPVCRRAHQPGPADTTPGPNPTPTARRLDHTGLAAAGQLTIPIQPSFPRVALHQGRVRRITTVPGPDTWPTKET
jgi:hypothetical protein